MRYDKDRIQERLKTLATQHASPYSTLVCAMGDHWKPGSLEAVEKMVAYTRNEFGIDARFRTIKDMCYEPFDAIGSMRNVAYRLSLIEGFEFLMYLDNDVLPPEHTLVQLLHRHLPIASPQIVYPDGEAHGLATPTLTPDQGLVMCGSVVLSCVLFKTTVFLPWAINNFWGNAIGDDEEYHFTKLYMAGHMPFVDTDIQIMCVEPPHFPLDNKRTAEEVAAAQTNRPKLYVVR